MILLFSIEINTLGVSDCLTNGIYADPANCTQFYMCAPYGPVVFQCPSGLFFNPTLLTCDFPETAGCNTFTSSTPSTSSTNDFSSNVTKTNNFLETTPNSTSLVTVPGVEEKESNVEKQSRECSSTLPYADPTDCAKYYVCTPSGQQSMDCAPGTYFDSTINVCNWPDLVACNTSASDADSITSGGNSTSNSTSPVTIPGGKEKESNVEEQSRGCSSTLPYEDPTDCAKYYVCTPSGPQSMDCAPGTYFDSTIHVCNWPDLVACNTSASDADFITSGGNSTPNSTSLVTVPGVEEKKSNVEEQSRECSSTLPYADPTDCAKYYVCTPLGPQSMDCAPGTYFDSTIHVCNWPDLVACNTSASDADSITSGGNSTSNSTSLVTAPGVEEKGSNVKEQSRECSSTLPYADPTDCAKYYVCTPSGPQSMDCAPGTYFDSTIHVCNWPDLVACNTSASDADSTTSGSNYTDTFMTNNVSTMTENTTFSSSYSSTESYFAMVSGNYSSSFNSVEVSTEASISISTDGEIENAKYPSEVTQNQDVSFALENDDDSFETHYAYETETSYSRTDSNLKDLYTTQGINKPLFSDSTNEIDSLISPALKIMYKYRNFPVRFHNTKQSRYES
ncbi:hypothetical protein JTB14_005717 [Gonioctena quinquepunctata]|nr:hypothetical protein JTB14_005717 [Gonioctena quinquepunctata]